MKSNDLALLSDSELVWLCVGPIIRKVRGKSPAIKAQVFSQLGTGQRSLFLFQVMYGHAYNGIAQFFQHIEYLMDTLDIWAALKASMRYFGDAEMLQLIERMESVFQATPKPTDQAALLYELDEAYRQRMPVTLQRIGATIRKHPAEFLQTEFE